MGTRNTEHAVERAHLLYLRGRAGDALRVLSAALAREPHDPDALDLKRQIEKAVIARGAAQKDAARARDRFAASACRVLALVLAIGALVLFGRFTGSRFHPTMAGPMVFGLRRAYWFAVGAIALAVCAFALWMLRSRWEPEWMDLDRPDPEYVRGAHWWSWGWWWWW